MKIEKATHLTPFIPRIITVETPEELHALWFLGCSSHVSERYFPDVSDTFNCSLSDLERVLNKLAYEMVP